MLHRDAGGGQCRRAYRFGSNTRNIADATEAVMPRSALGNAIQ
jgi:hypothetical protein